MKTALTNVYFVATGKLLAARDTVLERATQIRDDNRGIENIPWTMIIAVGGAIIAVAVIAAITIYVQNHLAQIPN